LKIGEELLAVYRSKRNTNEEIRKMLGAHVKSNASQRQGAPNGANRGGGDRYNQTGGGDRGKMGIYKCVGIAARSSTNQEISAQPVARNFQKMREAEAISPRSEPSRKGAAEATGKSGPVARRVQHDRSS